MRWTFKPWRERSQTERVEAYTVWSLYPLSSVPPVIYVLQLVAGPPPDLPAWLVLVPFVAHTVLCVRMLHHTLSGRPVARPLAVAQLALAVPLLLALGVGRDPMTDGFFAAPALAQTLVVIGTAASWAPVLKPRTLALLGLACTILLMSLQLPFGPGVAVVFGLPLGLWSLIWLSVYATSAWILRVVRELDRARGTAARLAVAEERLRFSRDLHDVFGRVLATVAIKSELAAELATRRPDAAAETMAEVRQLAQDSLAEVRAVAAGYRHADLGHELRGARALLDSAGVACTVLGEESTLPDRARTAFGWVVREAVTNVIRHSTATECTISLSQDTGACRLEVINNGVAARPDDDHPTGPGPISAGRFGVSGPGGSGLAGLAERLAPLGGRLETSRDDDTFTLLVTLPNEDRP